jgi:UDP-glucose:(heptosyl)LPS alpha-1,3-glucosyltransferase
LNLSLAILHADPARGGAERYTVDLAHALAQRGHRVSLVASSFVGVSDSVTQVLLQAPGATRLSRYRSFLDALDEHVESTRYDIVHAMLPARRCDVYHPHAGLAVGKADQTGLRLVFNLRRKAMAKVEHALLTGPRPPVVLSLSEYVKKDIRLHYPHLPAERLLTLFNAVDTSKFDPAARPGAGRAVRERFGLDEPGTVVAIMIAQDFERKGLREAILATCRGEGNGIRPSLLVVGKEDTRKYEQLVSPASGRQSVIFAGRTDDPYAFYQAADFFVLPTRHDPCSLVVLEALAMGLPVISTVFNGACEIMTDGEHGFVLSDPADVGALAAAMGKLLDPRRREHMSRACLELRPRLAYAHHLDRLLAVYSETPRAGNWRL